MSDESSLVWRILFGVIMASLLLGIFLAYTNSQKNYSTKKKGQNLANNLARTAFSALEKKQSYYNLPKTIDKSNYKIELENNTFVVRVFKKGKRDEQEYRSSIGTELKKISIPEPDGVLYTKEESGTIIISSKPITQDENLNENRTLKTPNFYYFAKNKPKESTGIISAYNYGKKKYSNRENLDIQNYRYNKSNNTIETVITTDGNFLATIVVSGHENYERTGHIENTWKVTSHSIKKQKPSSTQTCPSIKRAITSDWIFTASEIITHFSRKSWGERNENTLVETENLHINAVTVTTNVSSYPAWEVMFTSDKKHYTAYLSAMIWKADENIPGFIFDSEPPLEVKI